MKKTLLLADDSPTIQKVINLTFADEGIDVIAVSDGNAAIQQLREMKPDLVMADVHMPGLNGYQICERLRQNADLKEVPVILLVGSFEPFDEDEAKRVGADDFLMKPFQSIRQLVSRVTALLDSGKQAVDQPDIAVPAVEEISEAEIPPVAHTESHTVPEEASEYTAPEVPVETVFAQALEEFAEENDELSDFDAEFDKKFPDAAALSSAYIDTANFNQPGQVPPPYEPEEIANLAEAEEAAVDAESAETFPAPGDDLSSIIAEHHPERISDVEIPELPAAAEAVENTPVLELEGFGEATDTTQEEMWQLDLGNGAAETKAVDVYIPEAYEPPASEVPETAAEIAEVQTPEEHWPAIPDVPATETVDAQISGEPSPEVSDMPAATAETSEVQYNFRDPDAFDADDDIQETFHGLADLAPEKPAETLQPQMERVVDDEPGGVSKDQADGFSEAAATLAPAAPQVPQEAIDAATQKVLEQISEKVIRELVSGIMPDIKDIISKEIAKGKE